VPASKSPKKPRRATSTRATKSKATRKKPAKKPGKPKARGSSDVSLECVCIQGGTEASVWSLTVQTHRDGDARRSQLFHSPNLETTDSALQFQSDTWIGAFWASPAGVVYACDGRTLWIGSTTEKFVAVRGISSKQLLKPWGLGNALYLMGPDGVVLRSTRPTSASDWEDVSAPSRIMAIDGRSSSSVYAVGANGFFGRLVGKAWSPIELGVTHNLRGVHVQADGTVYVCGDRGTAIRYKKGKTERLNAPADRTFAGIASFRGAVYFGASGEGVDKLEGNSVVSFKDNIVGNRVHANERYLFACGGNEAFFFDGTGWVAELFV